MKLILFITVLLISGLPGFGQNVPGDFSSKKKAIHLNTGIDLKYLDEGNPKGEPVLFLHGYTDTSRSFKLLMDELSGINNDVRMIIPDLRGHGETSMPDAAKCRNFPEQCFTPKKFSEDIIDLLNQLKIKKIHVVGHSMGSVIAQELALSYSERVKGIVLIGTYVDGSNCSAIQDFLMAEMLEKNWRTILEKKPGFNWPADAYLLTPNDLGKGVQEFVRDNWVVEVSANSDFVNSILPETLVVPLGTWIGAIRELGAVDNATRLEKLKVPTLILWSSQDSFILASDQAVVKTAFGKAAQLNNIPVFHKTYGKLSPPEDGISFQDLGHNLHWAAPKEVAADIDSFLRKGQPIANTPYANPENVKEILVDREPKVLQLRQ